MKTKAGRWIAVLAAAGALAACSDGQVVEQPDPVVRVATVELAPLAQTRTYTGTIVPRIEVAEAFRVDGKLAARLVDVGDRVSEGQVLARLDTADLELQLRQRQAEMAAARANLATAEADLARARQLFERGHVTEATRDARRLAFEEARSRLEQAERAVALAANRMDYAVLRASADGAVSAVMAEAGQVVAAGQTVVNLARLDEKEIEVALPEGRLADLEGARAQVELWANGARFAAQLRQVAPEADPASRTYRVRFSIPQADETVRLGMTATLSLTKGAPDPVARIPMTALLDDGRGPVVFVVDPASSTLERRPVVVEAYRSEEAIVSAGLKEGEEIVTLGVQKLEDGAQVRVARTRTASTR
ncbi:efflux RND transporter periplasmic adaptor subunit [Chelativorans intermedius]|uniref:Efflux RND transporter periplasmic adaptor subunit n=1 Tax=Chelativorans intermedius TaxID=515947 RepID=A0ABV6DC68_9HYPH|nr:efflux RND transporter periplasmic adaptor subunit [Chelativorans intermedius]MCT9000365.1 efflux RND transporter periplasmic adaptor subunit [Chelativorans intermedius]